MAVRSPNERPALFLDRDGTLIEDVHFLDHPDQIRLLPGAVECLQAFQANGYRLVIVTNQSGVGRGFFPAEAVEEVHRALLGLLAAEGIRIAGCYFCPHHPEAAVARYRKVCRCRKPAPGLYEQARDELGLQIEGSLAVGDSARDLEAARRAGVPRRVLVRTGKSRRLEEIPAAATDVVGSLAELIPLAAAPAEQ